jgi:hypothetical protein
MDDGLVAGEKPMNLCACVSEERGHGEGAGGHATLLSDTLQSVGLAVTVTGRGFGCEKNP